MLHEEERDIASFFCIDEPYFKMDRTDDIKLFDFVLNWKENINKCKMSLSIFLIVFMLKNNLANASCKNIEKKENLQTQIINRKSNLQKSNSNKIIVKRKYGEIIYHSTGYSQDFRPQLKNQKASKVKNNFNLKLANIIFLKNTHELENKKISTIDNNLNLAKIIFLNNPKLELKEYVNLLYLDKIENKVNYIKINVIQGFSNEEYRKLQKISLKIRGGATPLNLFILKKFIENRNEIVNKIKTLLKNKGMSLKNELINLKRKISDALLDKNFRKQILIVSGTILILVVSIIIYKQHMKNIAAEIVKKKLDRDAQLNQKIQENAKRRFQETMRTLKGKRIEEIRKKILEIEEERKKIRENRKEIYKNIN